MAEAGYAPDWITGVSVGAINGADLVAPRTARKHRNGSTARAPNSGASIDSANVPSRTP